MINVCVPVLRRYDLLRGMLESLSKSTVPYQVYVVDNGLNEERVREAAEGYEHNTIVYAPARPMGVAESWNWFIDNVPEERIITNDDVVFAPDSLERMVAAKGDLVWSKEAGFSCFLIRDRCVQKVGVFDESISPGYGYYEDCDYAMRVDGRGTKPPVVPCGDVECGVEHLHSKTLEVATPEQLLEHHKRFWIAQQNYMKKWGLESL